MKYLVAAMALYVSGCASGTLPWAQGPHLSESECTASCTAHDAQCPQVFAAFPERGAVECPAEHKICLQSCESSRAAATSAAPTTAVPAVATAPSSQRAPPSKEARLRELKHLYEARLVTEDVYKERQREILSEY